VTSYANAIVIDKDTGGNGAILLLPVDAIPKQP
jgi:hypothetical protein